MPIIAIRTIIIEQKASTSGKERLFIMARAATFLLLAFIMAFIAFTADIPIDPLDFT